MNIHFSISSQMNIHLVIHLDNFWVCCPALRLCTSAAFCKWGLLECMLLSSSVLIPPSNAWPDRARSAGGNAHDRARSTGGTGPAVAVPPPASSAWIERENTWKSGRMGGRWGRPKADSDAGGAATWLTIILSCCVASCKSRMKIRHAYFCTLKSLNDCDD